MFDLNYLENKMKECYHHSSYHTEGSCWDHTQLVYDIYPSYESLFHDMGKPFTMSEENGKTYFKGHAFASGNLWLQYAINELNVSVEELFAIYKIVQLHMSSGKLKHKILSDLTVEERKRLNKLLEADAKGKRPVNNDYFQCKDFTPPEKEYMFVDRTLLLEALKSFEDVIFVPIGIPGAGKTYIGEQLGIEHYGLDDARAEIAHHTSLSDLVGDEYMEAYFKTLGNPNLLNKVVHKINNTEGSIWVDSTHLTVKSRKYLKQFTRSKVAIFFIIDVDIAVSRVLSRPYKLQKEKKDVEHLLFRMLLKTVYPSFTEGFDQIIIVQ